MRFLKNMPSSRIVLIIVLLVLVSSFVSEMPALGQDSDEILNQSANNSIDEEGDFITFIPHINKCGNPSTSPFAIQIAGLDDYLDTSGLSEVQIDELKVAQLNEYTAQFPTMVQGITEAGAGWARVYIDWAMIQDTDPAGGEATYDWLNYDNWLTQVVSEGLQIVATVSNPPVWAAVDKSDSEDCTNMIRSDKVQDFYNFLTVLVNRYKVEPYRVKVWEVLNEPDAIDGYRCSTGVSNYGDHGADYAALALGASPVIKAVDPTAKVIMGGIANDLFYLPYDDTQYYDGNLDGKFYRYFTDDIMASGAATALDAVNIHYFQDFAAEWQRWTIGNDGPPTCGDIRTIGGTPYYPYGVDLVAKGSHYLERLSTCYGIDKPLWVTEAGMHGIDPESTYFADNELLQQRYYEYGQTLENQARYVFKVNARGLSLGSDNITWYAIKIVPSITDGDYQGLLYDARDADRGLDGQPKPAFYAYQTLAQELDGYAFKQTLSEPTRTEVSNPEVYAFNHQCQGTKLIAWSNPTVDVPEPTVPYVINGVSSIQLTYRPMAVGVVNVLITDGDANDLDGTVNGSITFNLVIEPVIVNLNP